MEYRMEYGGALRVDGPSGSAVEVRISGARLRETIPDGGDNAVFMPEMITALRFGNRPSMEGRIWINKDPYKLVVERNNGD